MLQLLNRILVLGGALPETCDLGRALVLLLLLESDVCRSRGARDHISSEVAELHYSLLCEL